MTQKQSIQYSEHFKTKTNFVHKLPRQWHNVKQYVRKFLETKAVLFISSLPQDFQSTRTHEIRCENIKFIDLFPHQIL